MYMINRRAVYLFCLVFATTIVVTILYKSVFKTSLSQERHVILEVTTNSKGPIYPPDKILTLRVFNDAEIEFD